MLAGVVPLKAPSLLLTLVQRLPEESLTAALAGGGRHLFGYTRSLAALHDVFDALNINTKATGNWKSGKLPDFPLAPRPEPDAPADSTEPAAPKKAAATPSVAELYKNFSGGI